MKTIILGDKDSVTLFSLQGIDGIIIDNKESAIETIKSIKKKKDYGLIIVTEEVQYWSTDVINEIRFSKELPVILDIPDGRGHLSQLKDLSIYIKEAVGIKI